MDDLKQAIRIALEFGLVPDPHPMTVPMVLYSTLQFPLDDVLQLENLVSPATKTMSDTEPHRRKMVETVVTLPAVCVDRDRLVVVLLVQ